MIGVITTGTPPALLPKVMTAVITLATLAGPLGLLAAGALIEHEGLLATFAIIAGRDRSRFPVRRPAHALPQA